MNPKIILNHSLLKESIQALKAQGLKIVFTNGCFDLLHAGHVSLLQRAKNEGDILVVGVNSDRSVKDLKGTKRPIMQEQDRLMVVSALECVDLVTLFDAETPLSLIEAIIPDCLIKGGDWSPELIVGRDVVWKNGGKVISLPLLPGYSTTTLIERISKLLLSLFLFLSIPISAFGALPDFAHFQKIVRQFQIEGGTFDYPLLSKEKHLLEPSFKELQGLSSAYLSHLERETRKINRKISEQSGRGLPVLAEEQKPKFEWLSFWINTHNLFITKLIGEHFPIASAQNIPQLRQQRWGIADKSFSLEEIQSLLKKEKDPRLLLFLSHGAKGDPLPLQVLTPDLDFDDQLERGARAFFSYRKNFLIDKKRRILFYSSFLDQHREAFAYRYGSLMGYIKSYIPLLDIQYLEFQIEDADCRFSSLTNLFRGCIRKMPFDWSLNSP